MYQISSVKLYNRYAGCGGAWRHTCTSKCPQSARLRRQDYGERLTFFEIRVGNTPAATDPTANALCAWYTAPGQSVLEVTCTTTLVGRYVSVRLPPGYARTTYDGEYGVLTLCEALVYGVAPPL